MADSKIMFYVNDDDELDTDDPSGPTMWSQILLIFTRVDLLYYMIKQIE